MTADFPTRLARSVLMGRAPAAVGLDPRLEALPEGVAAGAAPPERIVAFYREVLPTVARHVATVKPNIAFFERYGAAGFAAYETTCRLARDAGLLVIGDVKRGDIGSTAQAYAAVHLDLADAVTVNPYLGSDAVEPFLVRCRSEGKGLFVLVRTSNPSAGELQDLETAAGRLCDVVARRVHAWGAGLGEANGYAPVGAVVGATAPGDVARLRGLMPRAWLLLPGVGAQGARTADIRAAFDRQGLGALVSQSRGVLQCFAPGDGDWRERVAAALTEFAAECRRAAHPSPEVHSS